MSKKDYKTIGSNVTQVVEDPEDGKPKYLNVNRIDKFFPVDPMYWNDLPNTITLRIKLKGDKEDAYVEGYSLSARETKDGPAVAMANMPAYWSRKPGYRVQMIPFSQIDTLYKKIAPSAYIEIVRLRNLISEQEEIITKLQASLAEVRKRLGMHD